jgi:hypothetical protein
MARKVGRPIKEIDKKQFESLCAIQCTIEEICAVLDVDDKTLTKWCKKTYNKNFSEVFTIKRQNGKASLRRMQWRLAEKNPSMAIFLGKNFLNQRDNIEVNNEAELSKLDLLLNEIKISAGATNGI